MGMVEYRDGEPGDIKSVNSAFAELMSQIDNAKALHVGTREELERKRREIIRNLKEAKP